jgi:membrane-bound inhibitor of C-type lysozyme
MNNKIILTTLLIIIVAVAAGLAWKFFGGAGEKPINQVTFMCDEGKSIDATFYSKRADIKLSDGRTMSLPQLISGSGARYGTEDENFIFWNKGDTAFITEGDSQNQTYTNCEVGVAGQPKVNTYASSTLGVTVKYPSEYSADTTYAYSQFGEDKLIHGVKFTVPQSMATGTNLSDDTGISLEVLPRAKSCTGDIFLPADVKATTVTEGGITYSVASSSDAGAGNRYEETVYAVSSSSPCVAFRYFIHYGAIENYPEDTVREFDKAALVSAFDTIRDSLVLAQ